MALFLFFCSSCDTSEGRPYLQTSQTSQPQLLTCSITNPQSNAQFNMEENITVAVTAEDTDGTITEVQLYVDSVGYDLKTVFPYNFVIKAGDLNPGTHLLKAVAKNKQGAKGEDTVSVIIKQPSTESPDFVTFSDGKIPNTWQTDTWELDDTFGYDDTYSLKATKNVATVVASKTFDVYSYVEFYTTGSNFYFYIDGVKTEPVNTNNTSNWKQWVYGFSPGKHVFKWETTSANKLNLDAIKFASSDLPEAHTTGVTLPYGGSPVANVNYTLSSNGNNIIIAHGICWSTTSNPTVAENKTTNTGNLGNYMNVIENLVNNTTYYVRAYATNGVGTAYGEELSFKTAKNYIGDSYQGGIVAYISDVMGEHGLIAAPNDQSTNIAWWNGNYTVTGAIGTAIGTGQSNTTAIVQTQGPGNYAAKLCDDFVLNGYNDWFLPSRDELDILYQNRNLIGGFTTDYYWSSSEDYYTSAWCQNFGSGLKSSGNKDGTYAASRVRAVRAF